MRGRAAVRERSISALALLVVLVLVAGAGAVVVRTPPARARAVRTRTVRIPTVVTYAVRVDPATSIDAAEVERVFADTLSDPRSWGPVKHTTFRAVRWEDALLRVRIRRPADTDRSCLPFHTEGWKSCSRNWEVFLNSDRWSLGSGPSQLPLDEYRRYLVNHEVGHSLGEDHQPCPGPGALAPVMLQQTIGLDGCRPNPWPSPDTFLVTSASR